MNPNTNAIYWNAADLQAAQERGEPLMPLTPVVDKGKPVYPAWAYDRHGNLLPRNERRRLAKEHKA